MPTMPTAMTASTMSVILSMVFSSRAGWDFEHRPDLDLEIGDAAIRMDLHDAARASDRLFVRVVMQDRETADHFLGLGERAVGDADLAARHRESMPLRARQQPA